MTTSFSVDYAPAANDAPLDLFASDLDKEIARLRREVREAERAHRGVGRARRKLSAAVHQRMRRDQGRSA